MGVGEQNQTDARGGTNRADIIMSLLKHVSRHSDIMSVGTIFCILLDRFNELLSIYRSYLFKCCHFSADGQST